MLLTLKQVEKLFGIYTVQDVTKAELLDTLKSKLVNHDKAFHFAQAQRKVIYERPDFNKYWGGHISIFKSWTQDEKKAMDELSPALKQATVERAKENKFYQELLHVEDTVDQLKKLLLPKPKDTTAATESKKTDKDVEEVKTVEPTLDAESQKKVIELLNGLNKFFNDAMTSADIGICDYLSPGINSYAEYHNARDKLEAFFTSKKMLALTQLLTQIDKAEEPDQVEKLLSTFEKTLFNSMWYKDIERLMTQFFQQQNRGGVYGYGYRSY